jgi:hypothetical protein
LRAWAASILLLFETVAGLFPAAAVADSTDSVVPATKPAQPAIRGLRPPDLAVVINSADPLSVEIGDYCIARRAIPENNVEFLPGAVADHLSHSEEC